MPADMIGSYSVLIGESNVAIDPAIGGYGVADIYLGEFSPHLVATKIATPTKTIFILLPSDSVLRLPFFSLMDILIVLEVLKSTSSRLREATCHRGS